MQERGIIEGTSSNSWERFPFPFRFEPRTPNPIPTHLKSCDGAAAFMFMKSTSVTLQIAQLVTKVTDIGDARIL
jgi:hypothetical protein